MEFSLLDNYYAQAKTLTECFNPCCNGIQSVGTITEATFVIFASFNPCCNGIQSVGPGQVMNAWPG